MEKTIKDFLIFQISGLVEDCDASLQDEKLLIKAYSSFYDEESCKRRQASILKFRQINNHIQKLREALKELERL